MKLPPACGARSLLGGAFLLAIAASPPGIAAPKLNTVPGLADRSADAPLADVLAKANPDNDAAWATESFNKLAGTQLKAFGAAFGSPDPLPVEQFFAPEIALTPLRPELQKTFSRGSLTVSRAAAGNEPLNSLRGMESLRAALQSWRNVYRQDDPDLDTHWKIIRVQLDPGKPPLTTAYLEVSGRAPDGSRIAQTATWDCTWTSNSEPPRLTTVAVRDFEEVRLAEKDRAFRDVTPALFNAAPGYQEQLIHGADHWYANLDVAFGIHHANQGLALGDINGDGREDLLICQPAGLPSRLFVRTADGRLRDFTTEAGLDWLDKSTSALFVDLDNDGDQDLAFTLHYSLVIFENDGTGRFQTRAEVEIHSWPSSLTAADYDLDGDLDLYICGYNPRGETAPGDIFANPVPYHDANNGARNFLIENLGAFTFRDSTERTGFMQNNRRFSFAAAWEDYDNDGDPDLYVANDFGRNSLYRNDVRPDGSRVFSDVARECGVEDIAAGMSVTWGDYDRDGWMDLYVSNMFSSAGNRITTQAQFQPGTDADTLAGLRRHARGNSLFRNKGDGTFEDVSIEAGVTMGRWAWGSHFADINNDGWEDLFVVNGFFHDEDSGDL